MTCNWIKIGVGVLSFLACFVFCQEPVFARKEISDVPDPSKLVLEAQKMVTEEQMAMYEPLPVEESSRDGYWWNKQGMNDKLAAVKELIGEFKLEDKKLSARKIVKSLDTEYNPRDNPLDIKMDKSIERMFNIISREMVLK
ncbi:MAG: hypothetical protein PHT50_01175 [Candidatus Omnitrophica bacterium]|nr:hypothetical protein [Candidatus Omnitrophota bacterium]